MVIGELVPAIAGTNFRVLLNMDKLFCNNGMAASPEMGI